WARAEERYRKCLEQLRSSPGAATGTASTTAVAARSTKATALFCLALARYCRKDAAFEEARTLAERALGPLAELLEEVETVTPGELAPSRDEVLRANPALVNLFKESTDQPAEEPETPGSPGLVPLPSSIATP
ncbi:MAG: hypothetical protein JNL97_10020, partial [Verrucomicrobiales bacterium]|nr:hypothetical protein [Verrucomicrobiales bacterium]